MSQLKIGDMVTSLRDRLVSLALESAFIRRDSLASILETMWRGPATGGGLISDLWVELTPPSVVAQEQPKTLGELAEGGLFDPGLAVHLSQNGAFPADRPLYEHQKQSILRARADPADPADPANFRPALVTTAGTGAGKTECFLLPVLDRLWRVRRAQGASGVRCIILYPMNALVNDQVDRLRRWLAGQNQIRFFNFTSETPEDWGHYNRSTGVPVSDDFVGYYTRQHARGLECVGRDNHGNPRLVRCAPACDVVPDILVTNYSMLEYMLCRPQDQVFFGDALEAIVLDEAHLYSGTLAAEIALLLRRVLIRCEKEPSKILQIATSATLGEGNTDEFAATLFSKDTNQVRVVRGGPASIDLSAAPDAPAPALEEFLARGWLGTPTVTQIHGGDKLAGATESVMQSLAADLRMIAPLGVVDDQLGQAGGYPAKLLFGVLPHAPIAARVVSILNQRERIPLLDLSLAVWGEQMGADDRVRGTLILLNMLASARRQAGDYPLVPHRVHVLLRGPEAVSLCLNRDCGCKAGIKLPGYGAVLPETTATCPHCRARAISLWRCSDCGDPIAAAIRPQEIYLPIQATRNGDAPANSIFLGLGGEDGGVVGADFWLTPQATAGRGNGAVGFRQIRQNGNGPYSCPNCGSEHSEADPAFKPIGFVRNLGLSVAAETILAHQPPFAEQPEIRPNRGRRLLAFTDGRQGAARLGPFLSTQHQRQLSRVSILSGLPPEPDPGYVLRLENELDTLTARLVEELNPQMMQRLQNQVDQARADLAAAQQTAISVDALVQNAANLPLDGEFLADIAVLGRDWDQGKWDLNRNNARATILPFRLRQELARPFRGKFLGGLESLGLIEVLYPCVGGIGGIQPAQGLQDEFAFLVQPLIWQPMITAVLDTMRADGHVTLGNRELDDRYNRESAGGHLRRFLSSSDFIGQQERARRRAFLRRLIGALAQPNVPENEMNNAINGALGHLFDSLLAYGQQNPGGCIEAHNQTIILRLGPLLLRKPLRLFQSRRQGFLFASGASLGHGVFAVALNGCDDLEEVNADAVDANRLVARRRNEYLGAVMDLANQPHVESANHLTGGLWAAEHTAQLGPAENRRLQDLFKAGVLNLLSSSTTLELGIDIGGLTSVMLANVPPGKANYLQRAGRAGRRADGTSAVVSFARSSPFDRAAFLDFGQYLGRILRVPRVMLHREKIALRHVNSFILGELYRRNWAPDQHEGAMLAYGKMSAFCQVPIPSKWDGNVDKPALPQVANMAPSAEGLINLMREIAQNPADPLRPSISRLLEDSGLEGAEHAAGTEITKLLQQAAERVETWLENWRTGYQSLLDAWHAADRQNKANAIRWNCMALGQVTVIEELGELQIIPRYGFPIGVRKLAVQTLENVNGFDIVREEDQFRLERAGLMALMEYSPGRTIVAGGRELTSRGLKQCWAGPDDLAAMGVRGLAARCQNGHFFYSTGADLPAACTICGSPQLAGSQRQLLSPKFGFTTAWGDMPTQAADRMNSGAPQMATFEFAGNANNAENATQFGAIIGITLRRSEGGEMVVWNSGRDEQNAAGGLGFAICTKCGYAEAERHIGQGQQNLPNRFDRHVPLTVSAGRCWQAGEAPVIRNQVLFDRQVTDIVQVFLPNGVVPHPTIGGPRLWAALAQGLRLGGCQLLELDDRAIGTLLQPLPNGVNIILFDNHPGGAGHVLELTESPERQREWLRSAKHRAFLDQPHHDACTTGCLLCLLSFDAVAIDLDRAGAVNVLNGMCPG